MTRKRSGRPLSASELAELKVKLKDIHEKLAENMDALGREIRNGVSDNGRDTLAEKEEIDTLEGEDKLEENEIRLIEDAIERMNEGTYGKCLDCGSYVNIERLKALPYARYCIECEEKREKGVSSERP